MNNIIKRKLSSTDITQKSGTSLTSKSSVALTLMGAQAITLGIMPYKRGREGYDWQPVCPLEGIEKLEEAYAQGHY